MRTAIICLSVGVVPPCHHFSPSIPCDCRQDFVKAVNDAMADCAGGQGAPAQAAGLQAGQAMETDMASSSSTNAGSVSSGLSLSMPDSSTDRHALSMPSLEASQASPIAASHSRQPSRDAQVSQGQTHTSSEADHILEDRLQAASAAVTLQHNGGELLQLAAAAQDSGGHMNSDDVPGPPPGSPLPAAHRSMDEHSGGTRPLASAFLNNPQANDGPDARRGSENQDSDSDSDVLFSRDSTSNDDEW